jgi:4-hydroxy-tetrahydrodipicolinate reductase
LFIKAVFTDAFLGIIHGKDFEIAVHSAREGDVVGIHSVIIQRKFDRLILTHEAQDRKLFAEGALMLAEKLSQKAAREKPYTFEELL